MEEHCNNDGAWRTLHEQNCALTTDLETNDGAMDSETRSGWFLEATEQNTVLDKTKTHWHPNGDYKYYKLRSGHGFGTEGIEKNAVKYTHTLVEITRSPA